MSCCCMLTFLDFAPQDDEEVKRKGKGKENGVGEGESLESPSKEKSSAVTPLRFGWIQGVLVGVMIDDADCVCDRVFWYLLGQKK